MEEGETCEFDSDYQPSDYRCILLSIQFFMRDIELHFITLAILALIIFISIFGKIKSNYRWFIMNQAIWDSFIILDLTICSTYFGSSKCFYLIFLSQPMWRTILNTILSNMFIYNAYSAFLLLTFSRFLCLYYGDFYDKVTKKFRVLLFILLPTLIYVSITVFLSISQSVSSYKAYACFLMKLPTLRVACNTALKTDSEYIFHAAAAPILKKIESYKSPACIVGASICSALVVLKVSSQFKYQYHNNRKDFYASFRITVVLVLQLLMHLMLLFLESFGSIFDYAEGENDYSFSSVLQGLSSQESLQTFRQIRVFLECVITLAIMTGYRESIVKFFKWIFRRFGKHRTAPAISNAFSSGIVFLNERQN